MKNIYSPTTKCKDCGVELTPEWIRLGRKTCRECRKKYLKNQGLTREIRQFFREEIGSLQGTVSHSRKGKPHKQPWGFYIVHSMPRDRNRITKKKLLGLS